MNTLRILLAVLVVTLGASHGRAASFTAPITGTSGSSSVTTGSVTALAPLVLSGTEMQLPQRLSQLNTNFAYTNASMIFSNVLTLNPTSTTPRLNGMHLTNQAALARVGDTIRVSPGTYWSPTNVFSVLRNGVNWDVAEGATLIFGTTGDESDYNIPFNDWSGAVTSYISGAGTFIVSNNLANLLNLTNSASRVIWHAKEIRAANEQAAVMQGHPNDTVGGGSKLWLYLSDGLYSDGYDAYINQHNPNSAQTFIYASRVVGENDDSGDNSFEMTVGYANPGDCIIRVGYARGSFTLVDNMDAEVGALDLGALNYIYSPTNQQGNGVLRNAYIYGTSNRTPSLIYAADSRFATHGTFVQCVFQGSTNQPIALINNDGGRPTTFISTRFLDGFGATNSIRSTNAQKVVLISTDTPLGLHANVTAATYTNSSPARFRKAVVFEDLATFDYGIDVNSDLNANGQLNAGDITATGALIISGASELLNGLTVSGTNKASATSNMLVAVVNTIEAPSNSVHGAGISFKGKAVTVGVSNQIAPSMTLNYLPTAGGMGGTLSFISRTNTESGVVAATITAAGLATFNNGLDVFSDLNANGQLNAGDVTTTGNFIAGGGIELANGVTASRALRVDATGNITNVASSSPSTEYVKADGTTGTPSGSGGGGTNFPNVNLLLGNTNLVLSAGVRKAFHNQTNGSHGINLNLAVPESGYVVTYSVSNSSASDITVTFYTNSVAANPYDIATKTNVNTFTASASSITEAKLKFIGNGIWVLESVNGPTRVLKFGSGITATTNGANGLDVTISASGGGVSMALNSGSVNPSSGTVYFSGITPGLAPASSKVPLRGFKAPKTGTINLAEVQLMVSGTAGSTESIAFHIINDTTATTNSIGSVGSSDTSRRVSNASTALSVTAGDQLYIQTTSPTWATPPTGVYIQGLVVIE